LRFPKFIILIILQHFTAHCLCTKFGFGLHHKFFITNSYAFSLFCIAFVRAIFQNLLDAFTMSF
jgi:hypothetical protein